MMKRSGSQQMKSNEHVAPGVHLCKDALPQGILRGLALFVEGSVGSSDRSMPSGIRHLGRDWAAHTYVPDLNGLIILL